MKHYHIWIGDALHLVRQQGKYRKRQRAYHVIRKDHADAALLGDVMVRACVNDCGELEDDNR